MIMAATNTAPNGSSYNDFGGVIAPGPVTVLCQLIYDLVIGGKNKISELNLRNRNQPVQSHADCCADDSIFAKRRINHPLFAEFCLKTRCNPKYTTYFADVFAQHDDPRIALHRQSQGVVDSLNH